MNTSIEARTTINSINIKHHVRLQAHVVLFCSWLCILGRGGLCVLCLFQVCGASVLNTTVIRRCLFLEVLQKQSKFLLRLQTYVASIAWMR